MTTSSSAPVILDGSPLTIAQVVAVARHAAPVELASAARDRMHASRDAVASLAAGETPIYGLNTGFGSLAQVRIDGTKLQELQTNIVRSHAAGVGDPLPDDVVRGMMLILAASLARGLSGVRPDVVDQLIAMLAADITPEIPSRGSVGASGDLAPLAHLASALMGEGLVHRRGQPLPALDALEHAGRSPLRLEAKEGLALLNGTHFMCAAGCLALHDLGLVFRGATIATAMSIDGCRASHGPLAAAIHEARRQPGQIEVASDLRRLLDGSTIVAAHAENDPRVQDPYSLRAAPQVLGAVADSLRMVEGTIATELGAVTDNPLVFLGGPDGPEIRSGGNFHGMPLAIQLDHLRIATTHLAGISERRVFWVLSGHDDHNPVTPYLANDPGLQSGLMIAQYTAAACTSELQTIANPASVANVSTSAGIEDYNSMGATGALLTLHAVTLARSVVAIELLVMAQAIEHQRPHLSGAVVEEAHRRIRERVPPLTADRTPAPDIRTVERMIAEGHLNL